MSLDLIVAVFHTAMDSATDKLVMLALAEHAWNDGSNCRPSVDRLATYCAMDRRTVQRRLRHLEATGWIKASRPANRYDPTEYWVDVDRLWQGRQPAAPQGRQFGRTGAALSPAGAALSTSRGGALPPKPIEEPIEEPKKQEGAPPAVQFQIPDSISKALDRCSLLGVAPMLRKATYWQAQVRAYGRVDIAAELLEAESWMAANPTRRRKSDFGAFVRNWLARALRDLREDGDA